MFRKLPPEAGTPYDLRVDGRQSPVLGAAGVEPRLAWRLPSDSGGATAMVLEAASSIDQLERREDLLWAADLPVGQVAALWQGPPLEPRLAVYWRIGLAAGEAVHWSPTAVFEPAIPDAEWRAAWITSPDWANPDPDYNGPPPVLGTDFALTSPVRTARLYASAAGIMEITLNGLPSGTGVLAPGYSVSAVRLPALSLDVTDTLHQGPNRLRVTVAPGITWVPLPDGRYSKQTTSELPPRLRLQLEIELTDGTTTTITTDPTWRATTGPVRMSHWYGGEDIDARIGHVDQPIVTGGPWGEVSVVGLDNPHKTWWAIRPPLKVVATMPGTIISDTGTELIVDVGTNVAGWPVLHLSGMTAGRRIEVRPAELLHPDGHIDQRTSGSPIWDSYTTRDGDQTWHPRHVYHGFRYLELRGVGRGEFEIEAWVIRADNQPVGRVAISDAFLSDLHRITDRAVQGNMYSVFTDCPNREKLGWIEQLHLCFGLLARLYDVEAHLRESLALMRDAQRPSGLIPSTVPETFDFTGADWGGDPTAFVDDPNWGGAIALLTLLHFEEYGDPRVLQENWPSIERYLAHLDSRATNGILDHGLGDWIAIDDSTPRALVATYGYARVLRAAARIQRHLGAGDRAATLDDKAAHVEGAFCAEFGDADGAIWGSGSQASQALALDLGVIPAGAIERAVGELVASIEAAGSQLTVGENSWPALLRVLHQHGRDDLIDALVRNDNGPGYGLQLTLGATSLTETWRGATGALYENSQNHFMLGMVDDWIVGNVVGLAQQRDSVAWARAQIEPAPIAAVRSGSASCTTTRGRYSVQWATDPAPTCLVEVPIGGTADVRLPVAWGLGAAAACTLGAGRWEWVA